MALETFLRGMETCGTYTNAHKRPALKPSLEGWKQEGARNVGLQVLP